MTGEVGRTYERRDEVEARLREVGVSLAVLKAAIATGEAERRTCTANDPRVLRGLLPWGRGIRALREQLALAGWTPDEPLGLPLVIRSDRKIALTIETGNGLTGRAGPPPRTKHAKGPVLLDFVNGYQQLSFEERLGLPELWILLVAREKTEIRAELSRPTSVSGLDDRVLFGGDRILLPPVSLAPVPDIGVDEDDEAEVEVVVERR
jgi:hypothetical protein